MGPTFEEIAMYGFELQRRIAAGSNRVGSVLINIAIGPCEAMIVVQFVDKATGTMIGGSQAFTCEFVDQAIDVDAVGRDIVAELNKAFETRIPHEEAQG